MLAAHSFAGARLDGTPQILPRAGKCIPRKELGVKEDKDWYRARTYAHFDVRVSRRVASEYVSDAQRVASHGFFPFISMELRSAWLGSGSWDTEYGILSKPRTVAYAAHMDSHIFAYYGELLGKAYEARAPTCVLDSATAYRRFFPGRSSIDHALEAFSFLRAHPGYVALAFDHECDAQST